MVAHIAISDARKTYGAFEALAGVSLEIEKGEFLTLLGPSGSGKSTLLNAIAGFDALTSGGILKNGSEIGAVTPDRRNFGMVFQGYALFPNMTVAENIAFSLRVRGVSRPERERRVNRMIDLVGLAGHAEKRPSALSGGQQQRCALARALVFEPELLLLDEPLSALDKNLRQQLQDELIAIHERMGTTFLFVTHDQMEAMALSDRIAIFNKGRLVEVGRPEALYETSGSRFVAEFLGSINIVPLDRPVLELGRVVTDVAGTAVAGRLPDGYRAKGAGASALAIRPERLKLCFERPAAGLNALPFKISNVVFQGGSVVVKGDVAGRLPFSLTAPRIELDDRVTPSREAWLSWKEEDVRVLFD